MWHLEHTLELLFAICFLVGRGVWLLPDWGKKLIDLAYDIRRFRRTR